MDKNKQKTDENANVNINDVFSNVFAQVENTLKDIMENILEAKQKNEENNSSYEEAEWEPVEGTEASPEVEEVEVEEVENPCQCGGCSGCCSQECDNTCCCHEEQPCCCHKSDENLKSLYESVANEIEATEETPKCIAEQLYTRHYNTWTNMVAKQEKANEDNKRQMLVDNITNEVVILFKKILSNTLEPHNTIYYELIPGTNNFDYYVTFGGGFENTDNKPYVKVCFDAEGAVSDELIELLCLNSFSPEELGSVLAEKLGFNEEKAECYDSGSEICYRFYYF